MERGLPLSQEHSPNGHSSHNSSVFQIEKFDLKRHDIKPLLLILFDAYLAVCGEELSYRVKYPRADGQMIEMSAIEATFWHWVGERSEFLMAKTPEGAIAAVLVYNRVLDGCISVRMLYCTAKGQGTGKLLIDSAGAPKKLLFQTMNAIPPAGLFATAKNIKPILRGETLTTWEMDWGGF